MAIALPIRSNCGSARGRWHVLLVVVALPLAMAQSCGQTDEETNFRLESPRLPVGFSLGADGPVCKYGSVVVAGTLHYPATIKDQVSGHASDCVKLAAGKEQMLAALVSPAAAFADVGVRFAACLSDRLGKEVKVSALRAELLTADWQPCLD